jgi:prepilin-type N-terminal cleavage/methylation domain-containing protein
VAHSKAEKADLDKAAKVVQAGPVRAAKAGRAGLVRAEAVPADRRLVEKAAADQADRKVQEGVADPGWERAMADSRVAAIGGAVHLVAALALGAAPVAEAMQPVAARAAAVDRASVSEMLAVEEIKAVLAAEVAAAARPRSELETPGAVAAVAEATQVVEVAAVGLSRRCFRKPRRGVTLLELLLALALSVVILTAVGMAINLYFKMLDVRRTSVEEMQVVRIVTQRMTNDIRMIVQPNEPDLSGLQTAFQNAMQAASKQATAAAAGSTTTIIGGGTTGSTGAGGAGGGGAGAGNAGGGNQGGGQAGKAGQTGGGQAQGQTGGQTGGTSQGNQSAGKAGGGQGAGGSAPSAGGASGGKSSGTPSSGNSTAAQSGAASSTTSSTATTTVVKLVGSATELQFDVSRIPRVDQYKGIVSGNGELSAVDLPSDVKTIAYYLRSDTSAESYADDPRAPGGDPSTDGFGRGLMRAEMDRAVQSYADTGGGSASIYTASQLLAEEVVGLGFEYFDATEWQTSWDSSSQGLPRAIRVWLSVKPRYGMSEREIADANAGKEPKSTDFYFIITLPTSPLVATTPTTDTTGSTGATSSSTSTSTGKTP